MFSDLAHVRQALKERLAPGLPATWTINEFIKTPPTEYRNPLVTFEFTRLDRQAGGQNLAAGCVAAVVDIIVGSPKTAEETGEDDADQLVLALTRVIDAESDIYWDSADKQVMAGTGQWAWRIHTTVITSSKE